MPTKDETVTTDGPTPKVVPTVPTPPPAGHSPRNFLAAFLLTMIAGPLGLRHFYLGDKKLGWVRTGLFIGGYFWMILTGLLGQAILGFLGFLAILTASVWALVDFFYVYNAVKTDADGQPLTATEHDRKWARLFYLAAIAAFIAAVIIGIAAGSYVENEMKRGRFNPSQNRNFDSTNDQEFDMEQYLQQLQEESESTSPSY